MKFLKNLALSLLGFLLFLSLSIFGSAFMLNQTILNPDFVTSELNRLDVSSLVREFTPAEESPEEFGPALVEAIPKLEPLIKEQVSAAIYSIYDYLLGKSQSLDLAHTLRDTILSTSFVVSIVDELDISSLAGEYLKNQLAGEIPRDMEYLVGYLDEYLDDVITELEPWLKEEVSAAADPVLDYLLGESQSFNVVISLEPVKETMRDKLWEAFLASPPPELATIPQATRESYFNQFYQEFSREMPSTFEFNESVLGTEVPAQIAERLATAEEALAQAKQYVSYLQLVYKVLIVFMLLLVLGIILISRQVRDITRRLGVPCLTYGAVGYAGIFVAKYFIETERLPLPEIPASLQTWLPQFIDNFLAPMEMFSLGLLIGGIVLTIVSFVYKPRQASS